MSERRTSAFQDAWRPEGGHGAQRVRPMPVIRGSMVVGGAFSAQLGGELPGCTFEGR